jgi:hypothetical protein
MSNPSHGAVCAEFHGLPFRVFGPDKEHERVVLRCLKSTIRSAKIRATKAAKQKAGA